MGLSREDLRGFVGNCDPNKSLSGTDERYVPLDKVRGSIGPTCVDLLAETVLLMDESCQLFTGFPGTGKTTELRRLERRLDEVADLPTHVVYVDLEEFIDVFSPISIADVVRILAYCMDREATRMEGGEPDKKTGYLQRLLEFLKQTNIELPKADGLKKIRPRKEQEREVVASSVELLFSTHASLLRLPCHVIYTFPLWLRYRRPDLGAAYDSEPLVLPMVKVTDRDGNPVREGIACLEALVGKRLNLEKIFGADLSKTLEPMILASGGYPRDLLRLVRNLLTSGGGFPVKTEQATRVIERLAQDYAMALYGDEIDVLVQVAEKHEVPLGNDAELSRFVRLLDRWLVLAYRNGKEWYDLHPMARRDPRVAARLPKQAASPPKQS